MAAEWIVCHSNQRVIGKVSRHKSNRLRWIMKRDCGTWLISNIHSINSLSSKQNIFNQTKHWLKYYKEQNMIKPKHTTQLPLGMLIPGYLDTRVPCGLPGFRPGSRETSDLPSYCDRLRQSTDCPCGHIQASTALAAAENAVLAHYRTRSMLSAASHPTSLQSSLVCRGPVVN